MTQQISGGLEKVAAKTDGRKRRWHQHKVERRTELVDGALDAIRRLGSDVQHGRDRRRDRGVQDRPVPLLRRQERPDHRGDDAFHPDHPDPQHGGCAVHQPAGFRLTREVIRVYVETVAAEPEPYRFVMTNNSAGKSKVIADSEQIIARMLALMLRQRMKGVGMDTQGVEPWAYLIVGGVQLATHSLDVEPPDDHRGIDRLPDHALLERAVRDRGSRRFVERFNSEPHPPPLLPG